MLRERVRPGVVAVAVAILLASCSAPRSDAACTPPRVDVGEGTTVAAGDRMEFWIPTQFDCDDVIGRTPAHDSQEAIPEGTTHLHFELAQYSGGLDAAEAGDDGASGPVVVEDWVTVPYESEAGRGGASDGRLVAGTIPASLAAGTYIVVLEENPIVHSQPFNVISGAAPQPGPTDA